jgi:hypothetical protein
MDSHTQAIIWGRTVTAYEIYNLSYDDDVA